MPFTASITPESLLCQVCAKTMTDRSMFGTNADGSPQPAYCNQCFMNGDFGEFGRMKFQDFQKAYHGYLIAQEKLDEASANKLAFEILPTLSRWKLEANKTP